MRLLLRIGAIAAAYVIAYAMFSGDRETFRRSGWRR